MLYTSPIGYYFYIYYTHWSPSVEFRIAGYYDPVQLWHAGSQDTDLSCHVPISTFCCTIWSQVKRSKVKDASSRNTLSTQN